jgi:flagella basal body P-ring formation protein FlgA
MDARPLHLVLTFLGAALFAGCEAAAQSVIELRSSVQAAPGSNLTLGQVAALTGADAEALAGATVGTSPAAAGGSKPITVQDIRRALDDQGRVNWGRIALRGSRCIILAPTEARTKTTPSGKPAPEAGQRPVDPNSVRAAVAERISRLVQADPADLRLTFSPEDDDILNSSTTGRTLEVKPTAASDKLPLALTLYDKDRIVANKTIRVGILVRRAVVLASTPKSRGDTIDKDDVTTDEQWIGPNVKAASPDQVIGAAAQGRISPGQIITVIDVAPPIVVNKGELVSVSCVSGSVVVTTRARALSAGRVGDVVQFQAGDDKRTFQARMNGRGRAVVTVEPRESSLAASENKP